MSKYKYTSLLSSQYRQVFKSYHSVDRCEQELKDNLNKSLHKRIPTEVSQIEARNSLLHYQKQQLSGHPQKPDTFLYYKSQSKYGSSANGFGNRMETDNDRQAFNRSEQLSKTSFNQSNILQSSHQIAYIGERFVHPEHQKKRTKYCTLTNNYNNYELKTKTSQINKRRNEIKLIARVKDIDKITKKYDYLTQTNQYEISKLNQYNLKPNSIKFNQQNDSKHSKNIKLALNRQFSNCSIQRNAKISQQNRKTQNIQSSPLLQHASPLMQTNSNKLQMIKNKHKKQGLKNVVNKSNEEENIQTPHFHQTQTKRILIEPSLISLKLQNLVKNTFTDRY